MIGLAASGMIAEVIAEDDAVPPEMWQSAFRNRHQLVWDKLRKKDGKVSADEVIAENYKGGSHHDGDRQLATAFSLIQLRDDPIPELRKMMLEEKPERRAFAVLVAGILGDARLDADIKRLAGDAASLGQFPGDWFWDTVGDAAKEAARSLDEGGVAASMTANGMPVAAWLIPRIPKVEPGTEQPATRSGSKSEGTQKAQTESEGRLRIPANYALLSTQPMKPEFHYTLFIAKPANDVWSALTEKKTIDQYHMAPLHTLELKKGGRISYGGDAELISGTISEVEAPTTLVHSFKFAGSDDPETRIAYEIKPIGDAMCSLTISHTGFQAEDQSFADITGGWPVIASSLKTLLETGRTMPWPKK